MAIGLCTAFLLFGRQICAVRGGRRISVCHVVCRRSEHFSLPMVSPATKHYVVLLALAPAVPFLRPPTENVEVGARIRTDDDELAVWIALPSREQRLHLHGQTGKLAGHDRCSRSRHCSVTSPEGTNA
jgi:hypothetical protein